LDRPLLLRRGHVSFSAEKTQDEHLPVRFLAPCHHLILAFLWHSSPELSLSYRVVRAGGQVGIAKLYGPGVTNSSHTSPEGPQITGSWTPHYPL